MTGKENWVQNMQNDQKLGNYLEVSNRTNQFQFQVVTDRGQPVVRADTRTVQDGRKTSRSHEIDVNSFHEEAVSLDRSGRPVVNHDDSCHEQTMLNEVNMDFEFQGCHILL